MKDQLFFDTETRSPVPINHGVHRYAEEAEVMLWSFAINDGPVSVWDRLNHELHSYDELADTWTCTPLLHRQMPAILDDAIDSDCEVWGQNAGMFDFVIIDLKLPEIGKRIPMHRRRDTMVQAYAHSLPGALEKLGDIFKLAEGDRKLVDEGKKYIRLFCVPNAAGGWNTKQTHPKEWLGFVKYAARDITTMRAAHRLMPKWNYKDKQIELQHLDWKINSKGVFIDQELAAKAIEAADKAKAEMSKRTREITEEAVGSTTQRDLLLKWILEEHGVELPDMRADTLERRMEDPNLPAEVKELLGIRLRASMNSVSKYRTVLRAVCKRDGRLRGGAQFRGAGRTGRWAHRLFQYGNLPRPAYNYKFIEAGIAAIKAGCLDMVVDNEMEMCASAIRGCIIAEPGNKLCIADLSNIEGRVAAWLAGEEHLLQAFRDYDTLVPGEFDKKGKPKRKGVDLYVKAYMQAFNVDALSDDPHEAFLQRQIGKVMCLFFQYGGGVGAWITGAATYGIDLVALTEAVYDTLPAETVEAAESFLRWLYEEVDAKFDKRRDRVQKDLDLGPDAPDFCKMPSGEAWVEDCLERMKAIEEQRVTAKLKVRFGLDEKVFVTCDSLKRLWRGAHEMISSYWKELEDTIREAIDNPGVTFTARKLKIRRDGSWLRIGLPSGRALCYPGIHLTKGGEIAYTGQDTYKRTWGEVRSYGGKFFENIVQAVACDQFAEVMPMLDAEGYFEISAAGVHDEWICETPDTDDYSSQRVAEIMVSDLGWNRGLPLAAAGFETYRYHKED